MLDMAVAAQPYIALVLLALVFAAFLSERWPPDMVAFLGAAMALVLGLVTTDDVLAAIASPAPATIAAMFILSAALVRTGALEALSAVLSRIAQVRPRLAIFVFLGAAAAASAFMNNTPVVMVLIPVAIGFAKQAGTVPSRLLIPLSYMVILGGTVTLIGTSTNLLVDGLARDLGLAPFGLFEIAPLGLTVAVAGGIFLAVAAPALLPERRTLADALSSREGKSWYADLFIPMGSPLTGKSPESVIAANRIVGRVVDVVRGDLSLRRDLKNVRLAAGDIVVIKTRDAELMVFREGLTRGVVIPGSETGRLRPTQAVEILIGPHSKSVGQTLGQLRWRRRFGVYPIALHRRGSAVGASLETTELEVGDTLLVEGASDDLVRLCVDQGLTQLAPNTARAFRRRKAPIAVGVLCAVVLLAAFDVAPILALALVGVAAILVTNCIEPDEGLAAMDGRLLLMIVSMLILGTALDRSGAVELLVGWTTPTFAAAGPLLALAAIYAFTSILTELVTNNAVAVLMVPIAAGIADGLGVDPRPFVVAVMFGASASFATPIGYQTNTLVYTAGGYRFSDFLRVGLPMNIVVGCVTVLVVPQIWPF